MNSLKIGSCRVSPVFQRPDSLQYFTGWFVYEAPGGEVFDLLGGGQVTAHSDFRTTQWSLVVSSKKDQDNALREKSLGELYTAYWYPLFVFLRRKGCSPEDASDYVQGFFVELIDKDFLASVEPEKGRFRWFLMSAVKRYMANERKRKMALKRGGGIQLFSLNLGDAEQRYQMEPVDGWTAEKLFDRRWALEVLRQALEQLRQHYLELGKSELYEVLQPTLTGYQFGSGEYEEIGGRFSMSAGSVKVAAFRLRDRYRSVLSAIVSETLIDEDGLDDEIDELLGALRG